jgi:hypothetical protein
MFRFSLDHGWRIQIINVVAGNLADQDVDVIVLALDPDLEPYDRLSWEMKHMLRGRFEFNPSDFPPLDVPAEVLSELGLKGTRLRMVHLDPFSNLADQLPDVSESSILTAFTSILQNAYTDEPETYAMPALGLNYNNWSVRLVAKLAMEGYFIVGGAKEITFCLPTEWEARIFGKTVDHLLTSGKYLAKKDLVDLTISSEPGIGNGRVSSKGQEAPDCPSCGQKMLPITYGLPTQEDFEDPSFYSGGCVIMEDNPEWGCRGCGREI